MKFLFLLSFVCAGLLCPVPAGAATASWQLEPPSFDFGVRLPVEGPTATKAFELQNTGEVSLTPALVSLSNQGGSGFKLTSNQCNHSLAPGTGCTIEVTFDPSSGGKKEGTLKVETASPVVAAATAQLSGSGGEPIVVIEPPALTFDTVTIPTASGLTLGPTRTITVTNAGSADLSIEFLGYQEAIPAGSWPTFGVFGESVGPSLCLRVTISPGGSCSLNFSFFPRNPGTYHAQIELEDNALGSPQIIPLEGTAVAQGPAPPPPAPPARATLPKLLRKPPMHTTSRTATFTFSATTSPNGFECRSSRRRLYRPCKPPVTFHNLKPGPQTFAVRALGATDLPGPPLTFHWRITLRPRAS